MTQLRTLVLLCLALASTTACASAPLASSSAAAVHGVLEPGGSARGSHADGTSWALALVGADVLLEVDGAQVRFVDGAPLGRLSYEHVEETATWRIQLASGLALCRGHELDLAGHRHELRAGSTYRFDASGRLESTETR